MPMRKKLFAHAVRMVLLLAALALPIFAQSDRQQSQQQNDTATIKVDTTLVTIPVSVVDKNGKFVPQLTKQNFRIYEDGVEQEIANFSDIEVPFNVVLLLDTSRSTQFKIEDIQRAALAFVNKLRPNDRVMVVSFDSEVYVDSEFTSDRNQLRRAIQGTHTGGSTKLYDAVDLVVTERLKPVQGRKAIVLFTDGVDTSSNLATDRSTVARVEESGVLVYPVQYDTERRLAGPYGGRRPPIYSPSPFPRFPRGGRRRFDLQGNNQFPRGGHPEDYARAEKYLHDLADHSGARLYKAGSIDKAEKAFGQIADELRHQYAISYYPSNTAKDGSFRRIRVNIDQANLVVRARQGYRMNSQPHGSGTDAPRKD